VPSRSALKRRVALHNPSLFTDTSTVSFSFTTRIYAITDLSLDIQNGEVKDLGISLSPPGMAVQFPTPGELAGQQAITVAPGEA
jgi:hypothetical protein